MTIKERKAYLKDVLKGHIEWSIELVLYQLIHCVLYLLNNKETPRE